MNIEISFCVSDIDLVRNLIEQMKGDKILVDRQYRNVERHDIDISRGKIWKTHIGCLLTSQQKSSVGSPIQRFLDSASPLLSLDHCNGLNDVKHLAYEALDNERGIRFKDRISTFISANHGHLSTGGWSDLFDILQPLATTPRSKEEERDSAEKISAILTGFGPKQSRNFLQWLGLTQHEIPIDSRIIKWLKGKGNSVTMSMLSPSGLADKDYYCCILDAIQGLCNEAGVLPCMFDAAVFASMD